jgi:hypothetical protein
MAKFEQQIADTNEYAKLISASLVTENELLTNIDKNTNTLGKTLVNMSALTQSISKDVTDSSTKLAELDEHQVVLADVTTAVAEKLGNIESSNEENNKSLEQVAEYVLTVDQNIDNKFADVKTLVNTTSDKYAEEVATLNDSMKHVQESVDNVNYDEEFKTVIESITLTAEQIEDAKSSHSVQQNELATRMEAITDKVNEAVNMLSEISTETHELHSVLETSSARAASIELALQALSSTAPQATEYSPNFTDALQELGNFVDSDDDVENGNTEQESDNAENTTEEE